MTYIQGQYSACNFLCNTDFENETLVQSGQFGFFDEDRVSCWNTSASDRMIEIWGSGFGGVPSYSGNQFAELNANMVSTLFQNFTASLGSTVDISFAHRGRAGVDVLSVEIGPVGGPYQNLGNFSAGNNNWVYNSISYTFPNVGKTDYSIRFVSVSAAGGATVGNFLDAISIKLPVPKFQFQVIKPSCPNSSDGKISCNAIQGARPFTYLWFPPLNSTDSVITKLFPGNYKVEITDFYGCKLTNDILLEANQHGDTIDVTENACLSYRWEANGQTYVKSGNYNLVLRNQFGCDSLINLNLTIHNVDSTNFKVSVCNEYTWPVNNNRYDESGIYSKLYKSIYGCDSTVFLDLKILASQPITDTITTCDFYTWPVNGKTYTQSGTYSEVFLNKFGCDSIHLLKLELYPIQGHADTVVTCTDYLWAVNNQLYSQSGIFTKIIKNNFGCDSICTLNLKILNATYHIERVVACKQYVWPINGRLLIQSGSYLDTLISQNGCDSIIKLELELTPTHYFVDSVVSCSNYIWPADKKVYLNSGNYFARYRNIYGCDSVHVLALTILESTVSESAISSCESYFWGGQTFTRSGTYKIMAINSAGCDSTAVLYLKIYPAYFFQEEVQQCKEYFWPASGKWYNKSGTYKLSLQTAHDCDSIFELNLTIKPDIIIIDTIKAIEKYTWPVNKKIYDSSGVYIERFSDQFGCDSLHIIRLEIIRNGRIFVPNVFSPNGDEINDRLIVFSSPEILSIDRFRVYDRWGNMLHEAINFPPNDYNFGWNGRFKGELMNSSVFVYTVEWTDLFHKKRIEYGDVTLIK